MIELEVVNAGPDPITIAQVMVDEAYWQYEIAPGPTLERRDTAAITIPYPWVQDEAHGIALLSESGVHFETEIPVAIQRPVADRASFAQFALVGLYVGIVPVSLGLLWYPSMRRLGRRGMNFVLALTVGQLVFLAVDMWGEAQEIALGAAGFLDAPVLVPLLALLTVALLMVVGNALRGRTGDSGGLGLAYRIAGGIGLHIRPRRSGTRCLPDPWVHPPQRHRGGRYRRASCRRAAPPDPFRGTGGCRRAPSYPRDLDRRVHLLALLDDGLLCHRHRCHPPGRL